MAVTILSAILTAMKPLTFTSSFTTTFTLNTASRRPTCGGSTRTPSATSGTSRDIPWSTAPSPDGRVIADELIDIYGSPLWERLSERSGSR